MAGMVRKNLDSPEETRPFEEGMGKLELVNMEGGPIGRACFVTKTTRVEDHDVGPVPPIFDRLAGLENVAPQRRKNPVRPHPAPTRHAFLCPRRPSSRSGHGRPGRSHRRSSGAHAGTCDRTAATRPITNSPRTSGSAPMAIRRASPSRAGPDICWPH